MSTNSRARIFAASLILAVNAAAQSPAEPDRLLIQSELAHLEGSDRRIQVEIKNATPEAALRRIRKAARLVIQVEGELPKTPVLTGTFEDATLEEVLKWFAERVDVVYRVDGKDRLRVFPAARL